MISFKHILVDILVVIVGVIVFMYLYQAYGSQVVTRLFGEPKQTIFIGNLSLSVDLSDSPEERKIGLSDKTSLGELEGELFIFDREDYYGMWMKDMSIPIDILWINDNFSIVYIEENVTPKTFPAVFSSPDLARFVLEMNAFFVESYKIEVGDRVTIPAAALPDDLRKRLQN